MKWPTLGTALRWSLVAGLLLAPTFIRYEWTSEPTWACRRDGGKWAGTCHGEPTLRQRLGLDRNWTPEEPRIWMMPIIPISDMGVALPTGDSYVRIRASAACWARTPPGFSWCAGNGLGSWAMPVANGEDVTHAEERGFAVRFNAFLRDEKQRAFVHRQPGPFAAWQLLFYFGALGAALLALRRSLVLRMEAWVRAGEAIPGRRPMSPYRG